MGAFGAQPEFPAVPLASVQVLTAKHHSAPSLLIQGQQTSDWALKNILCTAPGVGFTPLTGSGGSREGSGGSCSSSCPTLLI